jgi:mono/diheme cytochrome c family protein
MMTRCVVSSLGILLIAVALAAASSSRVAARQAGRSAGDGVYSAAQATRGEALYQNACASCHGAKLEGNLGPPLAGQGFLGAWNRQSVADLFDKIRNTMPADAPGTLTDAQTADLVAHVLQVNQFRTGAVDLAANSAALRGISMAAPTAAASGAQAAPTAATASAMSFPAVGNMNQVMRGILFPSSNILFDTQTQDPSARPKGGANADAPTITQRYGNVYDPWILVDVAAIAIADSGPILMTPGRRCENGKPVPVEQADWQKYVQGVVEAGREAYRAAQTRKQEAVAEITEKLAESCAACHRVYRDGRNAANRCTPRQPPQ